MANFLKKTLSFFGRKSQPVEDASKAENDGSIDGSAEVAIASAQVAIAPTPTPTQAPHPHSSDTNPVNIPTAQIKYQWVNNLNSANVIELESLTFPSLRQRWQQQPPQAPIHGVAALKGTTVIGLLLVELLPHHAEIISFYVIPPERNQGIGRQLLHHAKTALKQINCPHIQMQR